MLYLVVAALLAVGTDALDNGLALTPPMGWMHWQRFRCLVNCTMYPDECISEKLFRDMADRMEADGYLNAGYEYVMIDDCWMAKQRDINGKLQPDPERFPSGIKALADYVHNKGLKLGIYGDYGTKTCAGYPGSLGYLKEDATTFAEWEVDYLKFDACYADLLVNDLDKGYALMGHYLNETGRPIAFSCSWPAYQEPLGIQSNYTALVETCNLWRNWDDIDDTWTNVTNILNWFSSNQDRISSFSGPGHWNDPDMLLIGNYGLSYEQSKAQMAIWAIMAAPLIMSVDLRTMEPQFKQILLHKDVIAINQDPLGIMGQKVAISFKKSKIDVWTKPMLPEVVDTKTHAIGFLSYRVDGYPYRLNFTLAELNLTHVDGYTVRDVYEPTKLKLKSYKIDEEIVIRVKPTGVVLLVAEPIDASLMASIL